METVTGGKEIQKAFKELPKKLERKAVNKGGIAASKLIVNQAKADAPVDGGALKRNIKRESWRSRVYAKVFAIGVAHGKTPKNIGGGMGESIDKSGRLSIRKLTTREKRGDDPFYFRWQELGWRHAKSGKKIKGDEFLQGAIRKKGSAAITAYGNVLKAELKKIGKLA
jgi:hypothetical protein